MRTSNAALAELEILSWDCEARNALRAKIVRRLREHVSGCLLWIGGSDGKGYGVTTIKMPDGRHFQVKVHRVMYVLDRGPIEASLFGCHSCDTPRCANSAHIFQGTVLDNNRDMWAKGRGRGRYPISARRGATAGVSP